MIRTQKGTILVNNTKKHSLDPHIIGYAPDEAQYYPFLTGKEHLLFLGEMGGKKAFDHAKKAIQLLDMVGLTYAADKRVGSYSKGMKQRL